MIAGTRDAAVAYARAGRASASAIVVRRATPEDEAARCALFARVAMESDLALSVHRGPTFDALYALQSDEWESWVVEADGAVEGTGSILVRDGYLDGQPVRVGYLGDLRFSARVQGRHLLDRFFATVLRGASERLRCDYFLSAVIASNERALRALTVRTRRAESRGRPLYTLLREFDIRSFHLVVPRRREKLRFKVRSAKESDLPAIAALIDTDARRRPFGYALGEAGLRRRLERWPGLTPSSFLVAQDATGALVGCLAPWDATPVKRMVVAAYRGAMRHARLAHDFAATMLNRPELPAEGEALDYQYLTHVAVPSDDPTIMRALLQTAYAAARRDRRHCVSLFVPEGDPLAPAYRAYLATNLRARLYLVSLPGVPIPASVASGAAPGFEMALV